MSREVDVAARRFADANSDRIIEIPRDRPVIATVATVTVGGSPGGNASFTVTWHGVAAPVADCAAATTPAVDDRVVCAYISNQLIILVVLAG